MPPRAKTPAETAARKGEPRDAQWWYPSRCELPGCGSDGPMKKCSACSMVQYCCEEHQSQDWAAHKQECKVFQRLKMRATFYKDEAMLAAYPLKAPPAESRRARRPPAGAECKLCLDKPPQVLTSCCGQPVCDTSDEYQMFSYSREHCIRSHDRYTLCGYHGEERSCDKTKDWRECPGCVGRAHRSTADLLWRGLNAYNFCPMLSRDVPRHALCDVCDACREPFISGMEGCTSSARGLECPRCNPF